MGHETGGFAALTPAQRRLAGAIGGLVRWSKANSPEARRAGTAAARQALANKWAAKADPCGVLTPDELAAAVRRLQRAHYQSMALASAKKRAGTAPSTPLAKAS